MSVATALLEPLFAVRGIVGGLGFSPYRIELHRVTSAGSRTGEGLAAAAMTPLTEDGGNPCKVEWIDSEQLALGGYAAGSIRVGPITPFFEVDGVGYGARRETLLGSNLASGETLKYVLIGGQFPAGKTYALKSLDDGSTTAIYLTLEPVGSG